MYQIDFNKPEHVHFIGIGGISMSGLAEILWMRDFPYPAPILMRQPLQSILKRREQGYITDRGRPILRGSRESA